MSTQSTKLKLLVPAVFVALLAAGCSGAQTTSTTVNNQPTAQSPAQPNNPPPPAASNKFTDQPYYKMSYLISGDTLSADAKMALTGFSMDKKVQSDGTTQITLRAQKTEYHDQQYTLQKGDQLYFIEKFLGDDNNEGNEDKNMGDDQAVVVDSQGNVVNRPQGWSTGQ